MAGGYQPGIYRKDGGNKQVVRFGVGTLQFGDTVDTPALLAGGGTNASPLSTASAGKNFLDFRTKSTDATGADSRGLYLKHYLSGAGCSGEAARIYGVVEGAGGVAGRGAHVSLSFGAAGNCSAGTAEALRATLQVPDRAIEANGTYQALLAEAYLDGNSADLSPATAHALISGVVQGGNQAARRKFLNFLNLTAEGGTGYMVETIAGEPTWTSGCRLIRSVVNGVTVWLVGVAAV